MKCLSISAFLTTDHFALYVFGITLSHCDITVYLQIYFDGIASITFRRLVLDNVGLIYNHVFYGLMSVRMTAKGYYLKVCISYPTNWHVRICYFISTLLYSRFDGQNPCICAVITYDILSPLVSERITPRSTLCADYNGNSKNALARRCYQKPQPKSWQGGSY